MNRRRFLVSGCVAAGAPLLGSCTTEPAARTRSARRFGANISMLFLEVPRLERFARAKAAGFGAVEMQFDYIETPADQLGQAARDANMDVALINVPMGQGGEPFISGNPYAKGRFRQSVALAQEYCAALACRKVNVLPPQAIEGLSREMQIGTYQENLVYAAEAMASVGVGVVAEPVNTVDRPAMMVARVSEMAAILAAAGHRNLAIQFDVYHVAMMGDPPAETYAAYKDRIGHIQFADAPGRHEPGTGTIDWESVFAAIDAGGYDGWINGEYTPAGATEDGLGYLSTFSQRGV